MRWRVVVEVGSEVEASGGVEVMWRVVVEVGSEVVASGGVGE